MVWGSRGEGSGEKGNESKVCPLSKSPVGGESVGGPRMLSSSQTCGWACGCQGIASWGAAAGPLLGLGWGEPRGLIP